MGPSDRVFFQNNMSSARAIFLQKVLLGTTETRRRLPNSVGGKSPLHGRPILGNRDISKSNRGGLAKKMKSMAQPYKTKVLQKRLIEFHVDGMEIGDNPIEE